MSQVSKMKFQKEIKSKSLHDGLGIGFYSQKKVLQIFNDFQHVVSSAWGLCEF